jgi:trehalose 6-phosphate phosphatase
LADAVERLGATTPGVLIERKPAGVAVHDRLVPRRHRATWRRRLERWLANADLRGLERIGGKCVVELRPAGTNKGRVVETLPRRPGAPRPDASLVGIGDNHTDEDMFRALRGRGLAVRVGRAGARSVARSRLPSPAAVRRFLNELARAPRRGPR